MLYIDFDGNPANPTLEVSTDEGVVLMESLPADGRELEAEFGPLSWLRWDTDESPLPPHNAALERIRCSQQPRRRETIGRCGFRQFLRTRHQLAQVAQGGHNLAIADVRSTIEHR